MKKMKRVSYTFLGFRKVFIWTSLLNEATNKNTPRHVIAEWEPHSHTKGNFLSFVRRNKL